MTEQHSPEGPLEVLLVEDNPGDARLTEEAFGRTQLETELHIVARGEEALDYLHRRGSYGNAARPDVVLLDLNLPGTGGISVLEEIKSTSELKTVPVIILTSSDAPDDVAESYREYANAYLTKPVDVEEFVEIVRSFGMFWSKSVKLPPRDV